MNRHEPHNPADAEDKHQARHHARAGSGEAVDAGAGTSSQATAEQVARLQASVDALSHKVDAIQKTVDPDFIDNEPSTPEERRKAQWVAAGAMAFISGKLVGLVTAKVGIAKEVIKNIPKGEVTFNRVMKEVFSSQKAAGYLGSAAAWGAAGFVAGAVPGALLGYTRGERIRNTKMYWKEPLASVKILLGFSEGHKPAEPAPALSDPVATAPATQDAEITTGTQWREQVQASRAAGQTLQRT